MVKIIVGLGASQTGTGMINVVHDESCMMNRLYWTRLLAFVTGLINQELLLWNEYQLAENRILRAHLPLRCA